MDPLDRIDQLERRVAQLESLVRQLAARTLAAPAMIPESRSVEHAAPVIAAAQPPPVLNESPRPAFVVRPSPPGRDWEQWVGRRGLLAVGIFALIATAGFFLKYAIDRGWISPWVRVNGGVLLGALIAIWGDRLISRGMRLYGGAIIGAGAGLAYLALWAAASPYDLVNARVGILIMFAVTVGTAARAVQHRVEGLCAWALVGALCAPFFVHPPSSNVESLLAYLALSAAGCGAVAAKLDWRRTFFLAVAGYYLMPLLVPGSQLAVPAYAGYLTIGGIAVMLVTERRPWPESRLFAVLLSWLSLYGLAASTAMVDARWLTLACAFTLVLVVWRYHLQHNPFATEATTEALVFIATPLAAVGLAAAAGPPELAAAAGVVPAVLGALYLAGGWPRRTVHLVAMALALVALAIAGQWNGETVAIGWSVLALLAVAADRWNLQPAGRPAGVVLATLGFGQLFLTSLVYDYGHYLQPAEFSGRWSFAWIVCTGAWAGAAYIWAGTIQAHWLRHGRAWLWGVAGVSIWLGGSFELAWAFTSDLARDLAISAFWVAYAGTLVALGFRLSQRLVRIGGLTLAGVAALKVVLYDLSQLEALYRVGSFFALAVIALAVAYAYNKRKVVTASEE